MPVTNLPEEQDLTAAFSNPPEQVHRGYIGLAEFPENSALKQADEAFGYVHDSLAADNEFRITRDPQRTLAAHADSVRRHVDNSSQERARRLDSAKAALKDEKRRVERELEQAANLKPVQHHFSAIVGTFQQMSAQRRAEALDQLIEQGDGPTLAALAEAPLILTGLSADQQAGIKPRLYERVSPGSFGLLRHLEKVLTRFEAASIPRLQAEQMLRAGTDQFDDKIRHAAAVAERARSTTH